MLCVDRLDHYSNFGPRQVYWVRVRVSVRVGKSTGGAETASEGSHLECCTNAPSGRVGLTAAFFLSGFGAIPL